MLAMKGMRDYANNALGDLGQKIQMWGKEKRFSFDVRRSV